MMASRFALRPCKFHAIKGYHERYNRDNLCNAAMAKRENQHQNILLYNK